MVISGWWDYSENNFLSESRKVESKKAVAKIWGEWRETISVLTAIEFHLQDESSRYLLHSNVNVLNTTKLYT